jgi:hypothetical protein
MEGTDLSGRSHGGRFHRRTFGHLGMGAVAVVAADEM